MRGSTLRIAWRSLGRNRRRTALALAAIGLAQLAVLLTNGLMNGYMDSTLDALTGPMLGHAQVHAEDWREEQAPDLVIDDLGARLERVRAVPEVEAAYARIYAPALAARAVDGHAVVVVGVEPDAESEPGGLLDGLPAEARPREGTVLVGAVLAREVGLEAGDELAVVGQGADGSVANDLFVVGGVLRTPVDLVNRMGVIMSLDRAQATFAMPDQAHEITVRGADPERADALAASLSSTAGLEELEVKTWRELAPELTSVLQMSDTYSFFVLLIVFVAAAAGVANTMLMATFERRRELGMLLSLGTTPSRLVRMILTEAVLLGLLGVAVGSLLGSALVLLGGHVGLDWTQLGADTETEVAMYGLSYSGAIYPRIDASDLTRGVVGVVIVSVVAALWPAVHAARLEPMEAMRG